MASRRTGSYGYQQTEGLSGAEYLASIYGTEKDKVNCSFYFKVGAKSTLIFLCGMKISKKLCKMICWRQCLLWTLKIFMSVANFRKFYFCRLVPVVTVISAHELIIDQHFRQPFYFKIFTIIRLLTCVRQMLSTVSFSPLLCFEEFGWTVISYKKYIKTFSEVGKKNDEEQAYFDEFYEEVSSNIIFIFGLSVTNFVKISWHFFRDFRAAIHENSIRSFFDNLKLAGVIY